MSKSEQIVRIIMGALVFLGALWFSCWLGYKIFDDQPGDQWYEIPTLVTCILIVGAGVAGWVGIALGE